MMDVDAIIAEANVEQTTAPEQIKQADSESVTQASENPTELEIAENNDLSQKKDEELTPEQLAKREENRQSHLNRKLAKQRLRNENAELKAKLSQLEAALPKQNKESGVPKLENYDTLDAWVLATAEHLANTKSQQAQQANNVDAHKKQRIAEIGNQTQRFIKDVPEYAALVKENGEYLNNMPDVIQDAFFEADNAPLALYALMKEGRLDDLEDLSHRKIAMEIGKAEERGKSYLGGVKKATSASAPIQALKGTGRASKDQSEMTVEELMKLYK